MCYNLAAMKLKFIINPSAEKGVAERNWKRIKSFFEERGVAYSFDRMMTPGDGALLARKAVDEGFDTVVAVGGDGTASSVLNGLVGSEVTMGIIPVGVGNDFAKLIGVSRTNLQSACETILDGNTRQIDIGSINGKYFFNMVGIGFDGEAAERKAHTFKFIKGFWAYYVQVIPLLFMYRPKPVRIRMDGISMETSILFITIGNGRFSGGGFKLTPLAELDDGLFDVCLAHYPGLFSLLRHVNKVPKGKHIKLPFVFYFRTASINISSDVTLPAHIDGELASEKSYDIKILPRALKILVKKPG